ncbi:hypothetical protein N7474_003965 [Penicillium riverlandense]|uniref:uncharacterized protein n=1 Tax=Penicillium riverlandense TaxID=1903569 RepID=UPI0025477C35|nr:uncharacterized protein N7474_003965 [Penicillium riverlandense]KAJ5818374.1 hypothetical protein N7474_003965 [Penicillium riverlandense]
MAAFLMSFFSFCLQVALPLAAIGVLAVLVLLLSLTISHQSPVRKCRPKDAHVHLLVVLGSGGHTAEMFSMLRRWTLEPSRYAYRTYVVSSGDNFSAQKAMEFEANHMAEGTTSNHAYTIVTVPRARRVHQSYLTAPFSTLHCFWACLMVLWGQFPEQQHLPTEFVSPYPDLILTNGPATAVCMIVAAKLLRFLHFFLPFYKAYSGMPKLRTVFIESWARVSTLSMSGKLLLPLADTFLVQWPKLGGRRAWWGMKRTRYAGTLVD